ncbi:TRL-like family protein [Leptospira fluminis]|uniref:TRL-like family protein n=1 Tax=Leptospira fluminis TaxID=2484979 RepID=A0A4R9GPS6_9LEPT|nr:TRL-like family protein [Leptospira fluminis]TGK18980.1 TRL-like family protein [Leptospira fluminis]
MKEKLLLCILVLGSFVILSNCAIGPVNGYIFTYNKFPGEINSSNNVPSMKKAEGCQRNILGLVTWGSAGAGQIAMDNHISRIATIDHSTAYFLFGIYRNYCTILAGE